MNSRNSISRRDFLRYACAGAGVFTLAGCAATGKRAFSTTAARHYDPDADFRPLISEEQFRRIADAALGASKAETLFVRLNHDILAVTDFDHNGVRGDQSSTRAALTIVLGNPNESLRSITINDVSPEAAAAAVRAAETSGAALTDADARSLSPNLPPQRYLVLPTYRLDTATADARRRAAEAQRAITELKPLGVRYAGAIETARCVAGAANRKGLFAYEARTHAGLRVDARGAAHSLPIAALNRSIDDLETVETIRRWAPGLRVLDRERTLAPGRYTVVLGPEATAQLACLLSQCDPDFAWSISPEITIRNHPQHPALLGCGFNRNGAATDALSWIENGIPARPRHDGQRAGSEVEIRDPDSLPDALYVSGSKPCAADTANLIRTADRGLYTAGLASPNHADSADRTNAIRPQPGIFLIENGELAGVARIPINVDPIQSLMDIKMYTAPRPTAIAPWMRNDRSTTGGVWKAFAPALAIEGFEIS